MVTTARPDEVRTRIRPGAVVSFGYGAACYLCFVAVFLYAVAFLADIIVPRTIDRGGPHAGPAAAVVIDAALLGLFALQHSVMARPAFKQRWTRLVPRHVERSTYVLAASTALALTFWLWSPITTVVWDVPATIVRVVLWTLFGLGWAWVLAMTFAIDHLDMFGLRRVARHLRGLADRAPSFAVPLPHRLVRHPMMLGFFPAFLATPRMTVGHLLFAGLGCGYVLVGVRLEERDLARDLPEYAAYAAVTPRFVPRLPTPRAAGTGYVIACEVSQAAAATAAHAAEDEDRERDDDQDDEDRPQHGGAPSG
jgi:protein-S-isoprenylcysteine O-methyltransferase Ste14